MRVVAIVALNDVVPSDLAIPCEVFERTRLPDGHPAYQVRVCSADGVVDAGLFELRTRWDLSGLAGADTVIVPGVRDVTVPADPAVLAALRTAAAAGVRIASVCSGAFVLAEAGLLDGTRATTHWLGAAALATRYPSIEVDPDVLFVDNGQILTSAGAAAGMDLCLHMVRKDHGAAVAADIARVSVMPLERAGGQAQFIAHSDPAPDGGSLQPLLVWLAENLERRLSLVELARQARLSTRTLSRRFREQTGTTPLQWIMRERLRRAQHLLETTGHSVDRIAAQVGFGSPTAFRDRFRLLVGVSPASYRRSFRSPE
ncbi:MULTISPECIES: GlxA family transcriptional regulator [unclassified Crossiella]|uniref:GlxA family transcriptional regulator n=1 Tax=unclassified Crossiella TaxID=2620835 RepID=UPI001FFF6B13|nr:MULTISPECIES: helix-turn-helix domain-containing protein [unclassified Crossiella]MCK2238656.1 helix-turn-helix domain-containing protein [Crossiella sp. S99.2]MCK2251774.1 helix-turn-helix domain-containing protein [Crossiella sp. S99.1]